jgi:Leucine-rich repeat (LRR) protein
LTDLFLSANQISDISPLVALTDIVTLNLDRNEISDISPLLANSGLGEGDHLDLGNNPLDLSEGSADLKNIKKLEEGGVSIYR